jgi:hypothetical protein
MDRELRSVLRYILSTGDLPLDNQDQINTLIRICQNRINYINQESSHYFIPALDPDREDLWFMMQPYFDTGEWFETGPYTYEEMVRRDEWMVARNKVRNAPLSNFPGRNSIFHREGCIRSDATLTNYGEGWVRCEYCGVGEPN